MTGATAARVMTRSIGMAARITVDPAAVSKAEMMAEFMASTAQAEVAGEAPLTRGLDLPADPTLHERVSDVDRMIDMLLNNGKAKTSATVSLDDA